MTITRFRYSTELPVIDVSLATVMHMAANSACSALTRKISLFWHSDKCSQGRNAASQYDFFRKFQIHGAPTYIKKELTPTAMTRYIQDGELFKLQKDIKSPLKQMRILWDMLDLIRNVELEKNWITGYLLADMTSKLNHGHLICIEDTEHSNYAILPNLPFCCWVVLLQNPKYRNHFIATFGDLLDHFHLDRSGKTFCASFILDLYAETVQNPSSNHIQTTCIHILKTLSIEPEGQKAIVAAEGRQRLREILHSLYPLEKSSCVDFNLTQATLLQDILSTLEEPHEVPISSFHSIDLAPSSVITPSDQRSKPKPPLLQGCCILS